IAKKGLYHRATLALKQTTLDTHSMVQELRRTNRKMSIDRSRPGIGRAIDQPFDSGVNDGARAHRAGFYGGVESRSAEPVVAQSSRRFAEGNDLGMRRGIFRPDNRVMTLADDIVTEYDHGPDRDFPVPQRGFSLRECLTHEIFI